ncbi:hypothetical protein CMI37_33685 [Candidatus Pacearchaeota archaeon]|nr:hypothetical protein [Candidatus Pacearchaeota archaeon]|tara:strand:- start:1931 stop:2167 length:237 start_codon:yes stop_codon:yes gene_type:complete
MIIQKKNAKPGRPPVHLEWPEGEFTAKEVTDSLMGALSRVSVHSKIKKGLEGETPQLKVVRKVKPKVGRPETVYSTVD